MGRVFKQTHGVFNDHFVVKTKKLYNLFYDPGFDNREVYFSHVDLFVEALGEFHGLQEFELLVGEPTVLVSRCTLKEPSVGHFHRFNGDEVLGRSTTSRG